MLEASLIKYLGSDALIKCIDVYHYKRVVFIILEMMEQGSLTEIILNYWEHYSEEFCRYNLYKAALGLQQMHKHNVLHRDIKSDNILYSLEEGVVKITDLGFACSLSE